MDYYFYIITMYLYIGLQTRPYIKSQHARYVAVLKVTRYVTDDGSLAPTNQVSLPNSEI